MKNFTTKHIAILSLCTALIFVATAYISFPNGFGGYFNLGDAFIIFTALSFNPLSAFLTGGVASALADIALGYTSYAPFTFIIKGLEGLICSYLAKKVFHGGKVGICFSSVVSALVMALGYYFTNAFLYDSFKTAILNTPFDLLQGFVGVLLGLSITFALSKIKSINLVTDNAFNIRLKRAKSAVVFNDLSCYGGCSLVSNISILTALGVSVHPIPTAMLSHQTGYGDFFMKDTCDTANQIVEKLKKNIECVNYVYSGFLGDSKMLSNIVDFATLNNAQLLIDPVLADDGELYPCFTQENLLVYKNYLRYANVITPNLTEACFLSNFNYSDIVKETNEKTFFDKVIAIAKNLFDLGAKKVIITGVYFAQKIYTVFYDGVKLKIFKTQKLKGSFSGTGDLFASLYLGYLSQGYSDTICIKKSLRFISKAISVSQNNGGYNPQGIEFYKIMKNLL